MEKDRDGQGKCLGDNGDYISRVVKDNKIIAFVRKIMRGSGVGVGVAIGTSGGLIVINSVDAVWRAIGDFFNTVPFAVAVVAIALLTCFAVCWRQREKTKRTAITTEGQRYKQCYEESVQENARLRQQLAEKDAALKAKDEELEKQRDAIKGPTSEMKSRKTKKSK